MRFDAYVIGSHGVDHRKGKPMVSISVGSRQHRGSRSRRRTIRCRIQSIRRAERADLRRRM